MTSTVAPQLTSTAAAPMLWRIASILFAVVLLASTEQLGLPVSVIVWSCFVVVLTVRPSTRATGLLFLTLTAYSVTAWLAAAYGNHYFLPLPRLTDIEMTTMIDLRCVVAAYLGAEVVFGAARIDRAVRNASRLVRSKIIAMSGTIVRPLALIVLFAVGALDWIALLRAGLGSVLSGTRREYASLLLLGSDHNVQFVVIALSVLAGVFLIFCDRKLPVAIALVMCWSPFILAGSRKELLLVAAAIALVMATSAARRKLAIVGGLVAFMFVRPVLSTGDVYDALHEFILPQYLHFALTMGIIRPDFAGSFFDRAQFLLPGPLRVSEPVDMALAFYNTGAANVGVGANPFAEAATAAGSLPVELVFALIFNGLLAIIVASSSALPFLSVMAYSQLLTFGRSDTWIAMFFIVYTALTLHALSFLTRKRATHEHASSHAHLPLRHEHDRPAGSPSAIPDLAGAAERELLRHARGAVGRTLV